MGALRGEPRPRKGIEGGGSGEEESGTVACPCWLTPSCLFPAPSYQGHSDHQNLGGSHGPTSTPLPWHPLHRTATCVSIDSPSPAPQPNGLGSGPCSADRLCDPGQVAHHFGVCRVKWHPGTRQAARVGADQQGTGPQPSLCLSRSAGGAAPKAQVPSLPQLFQ